MNGETKSIDNKSIKIYNKGTLNEKGKKIMKTLEELKEMRKIFKAIYILIYCLMGILIALFIYTCISFNNYNKCRAIDFNSKSCEKWRNY